VHVSTRVNFLDQITAFDGLHSKNYHSFIILCE